MLSVGGGLRMARAPECGKREGQGLRLGWREESGSEDGWEESGSEDGWEGGVRVLGWAGPPLSGTRATRAATWLLRRCSVRL